MTNASFFALVVAKANYWCVGSALSLAALSVPNS